MMTEHEINLVKESFALISPIADQAADLFYTRLFEIAPEVRPLFKNDMMDQGRKLMQTIGVAVASLDSLDEVIPAIQNLGKRHHKYGVQPEHYQIVGETLLWTLNKGLGDKYTPEVEDAWTKVYTVLATTMKTS